MKRCGECGSTHLKLQNIKGSMHPWRSYSQVELLCDQNALVCQNCQNQILSTKDFLRLDKNIEASLKIKAEQAITFLIKSLGLNQEQIGEALGITPEYVSMVKSGSKILSSTTMNLLLSYVEHPELITKLTGIKLNGFCKGYGSPWSVSGHSEVKIFFSVKPEMNEIRDLVHKLAVVHSHPISPHPEGDEEVPVHFTNLNNGYAGAHGRHRQ